MKLQSLGVALSKMRGLAYLHPLLFAVSPVLLLYSFNVTEVTRSDVVAPLTVALAFGAVMFLLTLLVLAAIAKLRLRSGAFLQAGIWRVEKSAILTSLFLILFFNFGHVLDMFGGPWYALAVVWIALLILSSAFVWRTRRNLENVTAFLAVAGVLLVILPAIDVMGDDTNVGGSDVAVGKIAEHAQADVEAIDVLPDIYYIVPDRYGSEGALEENFGFDNSDFVDYLSNRGFYVASESKSNYSRSYGSLASSLNMRYVNFLSEELGEDCRDKLPMWKMMQDYEVWRFLKSKGYTFINLGDYWEGTRENAYADLNYNYFPMPEFSWLVFRKTFAYPFCVELGIVEDSRLIHMKNVLYQFDKLAEIASIDGPTFTFAHVLAPHEPYVFDSNGNYVTEAEAKQKGRLANYVDKLTFVNRKFKVLVDELLAESEVPPIIILQADEGPFPLADPWAGEGPTESGLLVKLGILNAYYLPGVDADVLYPSITPVNSFRLVFNLYFGTDLELLPDRNYVYTDDFPYRFIDVTDRIGDR